MATNGIPDGNQEGDKRVPQDRVVKDSIGKEKQCKCGSFMVVKNGKYGKFWGCPTHPDCKHTDNYTITEDKTPSDIEKERAREAAISKLPNEIRFRDTILCPREFDALYWNSEPVVQKELKKCLGEAKAAEAEKRRNTGKRNVKDMIKTIGGVV